MDVIDARTDRLRNTVADIIHTATLSAMKGKPVDEFREADDIMALFTAMPDTPPLEDVVGEEWFVDGASYRGGVWHARVFRVVPLNDYVDTTEGYSGTGPTIDAAIRAAIANAKGGEQ